MHMVDFLSLHVLSVLSTWWILTFLLQAFSVVFHKAIERAATSEDVKQRVMNLIDSITYSVFMYTARGLFERDKLIFTSQVTFQVYWQSLLNCSFKPTVSDTLGMDVCNAELTQYLFSTAAWYTIKLTISLPLLPSLSSPLFSLLCPICSPLSFLYVPSFFLSFSSYRPLNLSLPSPSLHLLPGSAHEQADWPSRAGLPTTISCHTQRRQSCGLSLQPLLGRYQGPLKHGAVQEPRQGYWGVFLLERDNPPADVIPAS